MKANLKQAVYSLRFFGFPNGPLEFNAIKKSLEIVRFAVRTAVL